MSEASLNECDSVAMVVDRSGIEAAREYIGQAEELLKANYLPSGWSQGLKIFEGLENMRYLLMAADSPARVISGSPTVALGADDSVLRVSMLTLCKRLDEGTATLWMCHGGDATHDLMTELLGQPLQATVRMRAPQSELSRGLH